ncbi:MAG: alpha/beta hydrolase [Candidatus Puniceispirillales bacterium]
MSDQDQWLETRGVTIRYRLHAAEKPRGRVLILPGFTEFIEKHEDTAQHFAAMGLDSLVLDWPGQGRSTRLTSYSPHLIHSDSFGLHLNCLKAVAATAGFTAAGPLPLFLFGHSMGGHLAMRFAAEIAPDAAGVMITAPMILPPVVPARAVLMLARIFCSLGFGRYPALFKSPKPRDDVFFPDNSLTRDPEGYAVQPGWWARDERLFGYGASFGWVAAAYASCLATTANHRWMSRFALPLSAHIAGDERIVHDPTTRAMLPLVPGIDLHDYPSARHELLLELPAVRALMWQRLAAFVEARLG